jgi:hypothetical protein
MKFTPWFPANVMPVHPGVYEVKTLSGRPWYRRWDGEVWFAGDCSPEDAASCKCPLVMNAHPWRGLATPPKGEMK